MRKTMRLLSMMALAGTIIASCDSEEDNPVVEPNHPISIGNENAPTQGVTLVGWCYRNNDPWCGGGNLKAGNGSNTRATRAVCDEQDNSINPVWQEGDKIIAFNYGVYPGISNEFTLKSGAGTAIATFLVNDIMDDLVICFSKDVNNPDVAEIGRWGEYKFKEGIFLGQDGTLAGATKCNLYRGEDIYLSRGWNRGNILYANLTPVTSMLKFDVNAPDGVAKGAEATLTYMSGKTEVASATFTVGAGGWNAIYMSVPSGTYTGTQSLVFRSGEAETTETLSDLAVFTSGEIYYRGLSFHYTSLPSKDYTAHDGETLIGESSYQVTIPHGATVRLKDVRLPYEGIICEGDANIIIEGANIVASNDGAIRPGPKGTTLTIKGGGSLIASGKMNGPGIGIQKGECGDIIISGGRITAYGGFCSTGIGAGGADASCGNILINGGTVTAKGGSYGSGIGCIAHSYCGDITITKGINRVEACKGDGNGFSIGGKWYDGSCGNITIGGKDYGTDGITDSPFIYEP